MLARAHLPRRPKATRSTLQVSEPGRSLPKSAGQRLEPRSPSPQPPLPSRDAWLLLSPHLQQGLSLWALMEKNDFLIKFSC